MSRARARNVAVVCGNASAHPTVTRKGERTVTVHAEHADGYWSATTSVHLSEDAARCLLAELRLALAEAADAPYLVN